MATVTEIYDYLRLLYARLGEARCHQCGTPICPQSPEQIVAALQARPEGTRLMLLAPIVSGRKGQHVEAIEGIRKAGFVRARIDGEVREVNEPPDLSPRKAHTIEAVVDRLVIREGVQPRLAESVRLALRHGEGLVVASCEERAGTLAAKAPRGTRSHFRGRPCKQISRTTRENRDSPLSGATSFSARSTRAPIAASASRRSSRGRSASTVPTGHVPAAKGWA